ncbi:GIN domain-containing protein [Biformimicrobium ophioploci]|uniref:Head GIN domain-containing protein n=1 Tax=Biformimicrobium ophioploci TaxID=3036711 RepID=A0ABQ6M1V7_9GAMM|nr:DUF2807 domain-containing protein [Microbulbifer sp. NKW57]GMG88333.1 head GIN domain-containing protein [Microbulbifer sp. NKW57]
MMNLARSTVAGLALALASLAQLPAALAEEMATRTFDVRGFDSLELKGGPRLEITQANTFSVVAEGPAELMEFVRVETSGDTLELSVEKEKKLFFGAVTVSNDDEVIFRVSLPKLEALEVKGSGEAIAKNLESENLALSVMGSGLIQADRIAAEKLSLSVMGSGDLVIDTVLAGTMGMEVKGNGDLSVKNFAGETMGADIAGSGDIMVAGKVDTLAVSVMGSGDFHGRNLQSTTASGTVMGSGDVVIRKPQSQSFRVMGSGDIAVIE